MISVVAAALFGAARARRRKRPQCVTSRPAPQAEVSQAAREHLRATTLDAVARLTDLRARGRITCFDYNAKKTELLTRL
jgi:hypothetical protein